MSCTPCADEQSVSEKECQPPSNSHSNAEMRLNARSETFHANNSACCAGKAKEQEEDEEEKGDVENEVEEVKEVKEVKEVHISENDTGKLSGFLAPTLLDDKCPDALSFPITMPTERMPSVKIVKKQRRKQTAPVSHKNRNRQLESHPNHLPFYSHTHYDREAILASVSKFKPLRAIINGGRYYIENDWMHKIDPWMEDHEEYQKLVKADDKKRKKYSSTGRVNRIVDIFLDEILSWECSREMYSSCRTRSGTMSLLWLGRSLAQKVINEVCINKEVPKIFDRKHEVKESTNFYIVNRIPMDIFFSDKEVLFGMLRSYMMHPGLQCRGPIKHQKDESIEDCEKLEKEGAVTRKVCAHQNLSLSLKPCLVASCPNYKRMPCDHLFVCLPETITINSYSSMLHFAERFQRVEDLKGCVFVTKPAYLCNARGIKFFTQKEQFEHFYHMGRGKSSTRHGVLLQRYIECPRLFNSRKFTIRFFILVIVLPKRRVIGFIHYGIVFLAAKPYEQVKHEDFEPDEEEKEGKVPDKDIPVNQRTIGRIVTTDFDPKVHFTNYIDPKQRSEILRNTRKGTAKLMPTKDENVFYTCEILPYKCKTSISVYVQMLFVAQSILDYMQVIVQDYIGTFQVIAVDTIVDTRNKMWVLGASTNIFSSMLTVQPNQRHMMSAIIQETLGITIECFYKVRNKMPLYWDYKNKKSNYEAFFFTQDFSFFYETERCKQSDWLSKKRPPRPKLRLEERFDQVDQQFTIAQQRKQENMEEKRKRIKERREYLAKVREKHEEES